MLEDAIIEVASIIKRIQLSASLAPSSLANFFSRRLVVQDEDSFQTTYFLNGGIPFPLSQIELRYGQKEPGGTLFVDITQGLDLPLKEVCEKLFDENRPLFIPPDPRDPNQNAMYVYRIPIGELRLVFQLSSEPWILNSFVIDEFGLVDWTQDNPPKGLLI